MAKNKTPLVINLEYIAALLVFRIIRLIPFTLCKPLAYILGRSLWWLLPKRRRIIQKNLLIAFPDKPYTIRKKLARAFWPEFCIMTFLYFKLSLLPSQLYDTIVEWENENFYYKAKMQNKGIIIVSAHFSSWELMGKALSVKGFADATVARPLDNPKVNKLIDSLRQFSGLQVIPHRKAVKEALKILKADKSIGFIMDQNFHHGGVFVNFFKKEASMTDLPAVLSIKTGTPLLPVHIWREGLTFKIKFDEPMFPQQGDTPKIVSQRIAHIMEQWITEKPLFWLWAHDRWKRQPD